MFLDLSASIYFYSSLFLFNSLALESVYLALYRLDTVPQDCAIDIVPKMIKLGNFKTRSNWLKSVF